MAFLTEGNEGKEGQIQISRSEPLFPPLSFVKHSSWCENSVLERIAFLLDHPFQRRVANVRGSLQIVVEPAVLRFKLRVPIR